MSNETPNVMLVSQVMPYMAQALNEQYVVHEKDHITDPGALQRIRAIVGGGDSKVEAKLMALLPHLEMISVVGVGYDGVDVKAALERGIRISHTPNVLNDDVADLALAHLLNVARRLPQADRFVRNSDWVDGPYPLSRKLSGSRLGLVGMGRIGQAIAKRALAFDMSISYTARSPRAEVPYTFHATPEALAANVDFLVVITPGGPGTRHLINAAVLKALGPKGYLVNVARGSVVDEAALVEALQKKQIAGAGLDVFADEPRVSAELRNLQNVVLTPHVGSATFETRKAMSDLALANLRAHFQGEPLVSPIPECQA
ncbi:MAG: 2-hydroxyacid dehydrogenase [Betaproteobacteria bacterium]|jgi:hydroxypyruvate reductase|nr:2-hydroxyacid dehydrogenase [Betaproteobacteria bacterium]NBP45633.1 2-hydroxyacid dehydrogenase [Betaproteobacteria bacterium]